jgi:hydroxymethylpyrimidine/phosphomethylpyrimidine kinase
MIPPILCIGQSDSSAGTGIQADIKATQALGGYAASVITAVTAQTAKDMYQIFPLPPTLVRNQIDCVMDTLNPPIIKTGTLVDTAIIDTVGDFLDERDQGYDILKVVVDPVMTHQNGEKFLNKGGRDALKRRLLIHADLLLPNIIEAEELTGMEIKDVETACHAAETLHTLGAKTVVLKCGLLGTEENYDIVSDGTEMHVLQSRRIPIKSTHGAGDTLSAAIAVGLAYDKTPLEAFKAAREYLNHCLENNVTLGQEYEVLSHLHDSLPEENTTSKVA